ncbi:MAG: helix-turn-helix domain-containing protein [bacterium]|nr:helix-turn-helix domain-containing protein [bacterium]
MTVAEAARRLNICPRRVRDLIASGDIPAERHGRDWWVTSVDVTWNRKRGRPKGVRK